MSLKVAVIGAGIVGVSSAIQIAEKYKNNVNVTIVTDSITPNTTGDGSAGLWTAYFIIGPANDREKLCEWGQASFTEYHRLWKSGLCEESGLMLLPFLNLSGQPEPMDAFSKNIVYGYTALSPNEISKFSHELGKDYKSGSRSIGFACEVKRYLPFLMERFKNIGGTIIRQHVESFDDLCEDYDVIINCTGVNAANLTNDPEIIPIRGQSVRVEAPWFFHCVIDDTRSGFIAPNIESVFLGGTAQYGNYDQTIDPLDSEKIIDGCQTICKSLKNAKLLWEWTGLRPGRNSIRLEYELYESANGKNVPVIHNYGHGGSGITLAWGCGYDVAKLLGKVFTKISTLLQKCK